MDQTTTATFLRSPGCWCAGLLFPLGAVVIILRSTRNLLRTSRSNDARFASGGDLANWYGASVRGPSYSLSLYHPGRGTRVSTPRRDRIPASRLQKCLVSASPQNLDPAEAPLHYSISTDVIIFRPSHALPRPHSYWWEIASLAQRTILTGWLLLLDVDLQFLRLLAALVISIAFLIALLSCRPYARRRSSNL